MSRKLERDDAVFWMSVLVRLEKLSTSARLKRSDLWFIRLHGYLQ